MSSNKLQDGCLYDAAEAMNLLYFAKHKLRYFSQFAEYNRIHDVLRKVALSCNTYLFLILKAELHFKQDVLIRVTVPVPNSEY